MLYREAARFGREGKWAEAAEYLERCCKLARYELPALNSQWMVAADRAGRSYDIGGKALAFAQRAWEIGSLNGALEFLQVALYKGCLVPESAVLANQNAHEWLLSIARKFSFPELEPAEPFPGRLRIGHLVGLLNPTHAPTKLIRVLIDELGAKGADSRVYATEWAASWFHNWNCSRQSGPDDFVASMQSAHIQEAQKGFLDRALALSSQIRRDRIDVLVVHASMSEMVTCLVSLMRPARRLVSVNHASEMDLPCFDGAIHLFECGQRQTKQKNIPSAVIPPASDMITRLRLASRYTKAQLNLPEHATLSGTFGNLYKVDNPEYLKSLSCMLRAHPHHHHLLAGGGDQSSIMSFLLQEGLADRVHLLGRRTDIPSLLLLLDFYLASHPYPGALSEIEAMAAACPVISVRDRLDSHYNAGAESVGIPECIVDPGDTDALVELASRYLGDSLWSRAIGRKLMARFESRFVPARVAEDHFNFYQFLIQTMSEPKKASG